MHGVLALRPRVEHMKISKLMIGFALLAIGLFLSIGAWNTIQSYQGGILSNPHVRPGPEYPFWMPLSYIVFKVPDYLLQYLILGVFTATVGITIIVSSLLKQLIPYNDSQGANSVGE